MNFAHSVCYKLDTNLFMTEMSNYYLESKHKIVIIYQVNSKQVKNPNAVMKVLPYVGTAQLVFIPIKPMVTTSHTLASPNFNQDV